MVCDEQRSQAKVLLQSKLEVCFGAGSRQARWLC